LPDGLQSLAQGYDKPETFWADVSRLKAMDAEAKAVKGISPDKLVSDEEIAKAFKALGKPDDKSGYKLSETWEGSKLWQPDGGEGPEAPEAVKAQVNEILRKDREQFQTLSDKANLTQKQSQALWQMWGSVVARSVSALDAQRAEMDPARTVPELWPADTAAHVNTARRGAHAAGLGDELDAAGLSGNPLVLTLCRALGEALGEDKAAGIGGAGGALLPTGAAAKEELYRVVGSQAYKDGDKTAQRMAEQLSARVHIK
jgi:hypothetical protein